MKVSTAKLLLLCCNYNGGEWRVGRKGTRDKEVETRDRRILYPSHLLILMKWLKFQMGNLSRGMNRLMLWIMNVSPSKP